MKFKAVALLCFLLFTSTDASTQGGAEGPCPPGMHLEGLSCVFDNSGSSQQQPRGRWETRWGAIAIGSTATGGGVGVAADMRTKRQAERTAISQCESTGGGELCKKYVLHYRNQCAVIVWGDTSPVMQSAETIEIATQIATQKCNARTTNCKTFYTNCTDAQWVE